MVATARVVAAAMRASPARWPDHRHRLFPVSVAAGRTLSATLNHTVSTQNYQLYLYNAAGTSRAGPRARGRQASRRRSRCANGTTAAVNYLVRVVYASGGTGSTSGRYALNLLQQ